MKIRNIVRICILTATLGLCMVLPVFALDEESTSVEGDFGINCHYTLDENMGLTISKADSDQEASFRASELQQAIADGNKSWYRITSFAVKGGTTITVNNDNNGAYDTGVDEMFRSCTDLKSVDLRGLDTGNVNRMSDMFQGCSALENINLSGLDTGNVKNMYEMFEHCESLRNIDLSGINTGKVTNMGYMFRYCTALDSADLRGLDTHNVTDMAGMFDHCMSLKNVYLTGIDTGNVESMGTMFAYCYSLEKLDLSGMNTGSLNAMNGMFKECTSLKSVDLTGFNTGNVGEMVGLFEKCGELESLNLTSFDTGKASWLQFVFKECTKLKTIYASDKFVIPEGAYTLQMFYGCTSLVGESGTALADIEVKDPDNYDKGTYARIDGADGRPGYFTRGYAGIPIDETTFPDGNFRDFVKSEIAGGDNYLTQEQIASTTEIDIANKSIADLKGIELFTSLTKLECYGNELTGLDVSRNTALEYLDCYGNNLGSLDISNNTELAYFECEGNQLNSIDVSNNRKLEYLYLNDNQLTSLDVSNNTALIELKCEKNQLNNIDVSNNTKLIWLYCTDNDLTGIDVSKCTELYGLLCDNNQITSLDVSNNIELEYLDCFGQSYNKVNKTVEVNGKNEFDFSSIASLNADKVLNVTGGTLSGNILTFTAQAAIITYDCGANKTLGFMLKAKNYVAPQQPTAKKGPTNIKAKTYWRKSVVTWKNTSNKKTVSKVYVQYSKTENFTKGVKTKKLAPGKKKVILKKLKKNTKYYIHICYKYKDGSKSEWSKVKKIKTRK